VAKRSGAGSGRGIGDEYLAGQDVEAYLDRLCLELREVYREAREELNKVLRRSTSTDFAKWRASEQLRQIKAIIAALNVEARRFSTKVAPAAYRRGASITEERVAAQGVRMNVNFGNRIHAPAIDVLADELALDLLQANGTLDRSAQRLVRATQQALVEDRQITRMVAQGAIRGETLRDTSKRIRTALEEQLEAGAKIVIRGRDGKERQYDPADYAEVVALTRTREAVTQGALNTGRELGLDLYQVSYHRSSCPECVPKQGKVYSATGDTPGFPKLTADKRPPFHPRCRHVLMAVVEIPGREWEIEALRELSNSKADIGSRADYDAWLKKYKP
jgi:hypothetical protein